MKESRKTAVCFRLAFMGDGLISTSGLVFPFLAKLQNRCSGSILLVGKDLQNKENSFSFVFVFSAVNKLFCTIYLE